MSAFYGSDVDIRNASGVLQHLSNDDLEAMLNETSNQKIDILIKDLPQVKSLEAERERLIQENKHMAESNLSFESTYCLSRQQLIKALQECQTLKDDLERKKSKLRELSRQNSLDTTLALMQAAMAEAEEASEEMANSFLNKNTSIEQFLPNFIDKRKVYHSRRIKVEKMPEQMNKLHSSVLQPVRAAPPPPPTPPTLPFSQMSVGSNSEANIPPYPTTNNPFVPFIPYQPNRPYNH